MSKHRPEPDKMMQAESRTEQAKAKLDKMRQAQSRTEQAQSRTRGTASKFQIWCLHCHSHCCERGDEQASRLQELVVPRVELERSEASVGGEKPLEVSRDVGGGARGLSRDTEAQVA